MRLIWGLLFLSAFFSFTSVSYADTQRGLRNYQAIMSGQKKIEQLSQQELQEVLDVYEKLKNQKGDNSCSDSIESQIDGSFKGWDGETVFKLTNGQVWQQSSYSYTYHYSYRPTVLIYPTDGGCKMKVDGVSDSIPVKRLK